jgi:hypothetical protein
MKALTAAALTGLVLTGGIAGAYGRGSPHGAHSAQELAVDPCGWKNGSLPDPAETRRCLAARYKAAQSKASTQTQPAAPPDSAGK